MIENDFKYLLYKILGISSYKDISINSLRDLVYQIYYEHNIREEYHFAHDIFDIPEDSIEIPIMSEKK